MCSLCSLSGVLLIKWLITAKKTVESGSSLAKLKIGKQAINLVIWSRGRSGGCTKGCGAVCTVCLLATCAHGPAEMAARSAIPTTGYGGAVTVIASGKFAQGATDVLCPFNALYFKKVFTKRSSKYIQFPFSTKNYLDLKLGLNP